MSMDIAIFKNEEFGQVRSVMIGDVPWFVGKDVAEALGYSNTRDALATHVSDEDKNTVVISDGKEAIRIISSSMNQGSML